MFGESSCIHIYGQWLGTGFVSNRDQTMRSLPESSIL